MQKVESLERPIVGVKSDVVALQSKTKTMENTMHQMESGLSFSEVEMMKLKKHVEKNQQEIKELEDRLLYKEVYDRRENLRFLGIPEEADENTSEVLYQFVADKLNIEGAREIEFQCVHRIGNKRSRSIRPIIARFLRFPDRERVFRKAMELKDGLDVYTDFPKEIQDRKRKQWSKMKRAREAGKTAFFSKHEPDKPFIDGVYFPLIASQNNPASVE